jgi:adenosylcobinamide-phosphate synthase
MINEKVWQRAATIGVAMILDAAFAEPPLAAHPVRWMGRYLHAAGRRVRPTPPGWALTGGAAAWAGGAALTLGAAVVVGRLAPARPGRRALALGTALWPLFAYRMLIDEVAAVDRALETSLDAGRAALSRLVSRNVSSLDESEVRQAAIESLAENLSDSVTAPLFWFAVGGLPAAAFYRFVNTADAVWGYRTARWEYAGKVAARADDVLNVIPSRLTGLALAGTRVRLRDLRREARNTPSPNAGWPMAATALRLGIRLGKAGTYTLNTQGRPPTHADLAAALRLASPSPRRSTGGSRLTTLLRPHRVDHGKVAHFDHRKGAGSP